MKQKEIIRKIIIITLLILCIKFVNAENTIQYTNIYEVPKEWCNNLYIQVSGINITSNDYDFSDCGELEINKWFCNCNTKRDFDLIFINKVNDYNSYVIDVISTTNKVRKVISRNKFLQDESIKEEKITIENNDKLNIGFKIIEIQNKLDQLETKTRLLDQNKDRPITKNIIENNYDDTEIYNRIMVLEDHIIKFNATILIIYFLIIILFGLVIYLYKIRK